MSTLKNVQRPSIDRFDVVDPSIHPHCRHARTISLSRRSTSFRYCLLSSEAPGCCAAHPPPTPVRYRGMRVGWCGLSFRLGILTSEPVAHAPMYLLSGAAAAPPPRPA